jgi:hypothetical protein
MFDVEATDQFMDWFTALDKPEQDAVAARVDLLAEHGPGLKRPAVGEIATSRFAPRMKELRCGTAGAIRVLFIFDPRRTAILLFEVPRREHGPSGTRGLFLPRTSSTRSTLKS